MPDDQKNFDEAAFRALLDAESQDKSKAIAATNDWLVEWREKTFRKEQERLANDPDFSPVMTTSDLLLKALGGWKDVRGRGIMTAESYWQREVMPHLELLQSGPQAKTLRKMFKDANLGRGGWEQEFVARLNGDKDSRTRFKALYDDLGLREVADPEPAPAPAPQSETGVVRQALNPPINLCTAAPFGIVLGGRSDSGLAINTSTAGGAVNGSGFVQAQSLALVVMGGGTHAITLIGSSFDIPADYSTLSCTATIDISFFASSLAIFAGSTASMNALLRVQRSDGAVFPLAQRLTAIPSPVIAYREERRDIVDLELSIPDIPLNGVAGPVRIFAGAEAFAAAAGIVGSSFGLMSATFTLKRLCISVR